MGLDVRLCRHTTQPWCADDTSWMYLSCTDPGRTRPAVRSPVCPRDADPRRARPVPSTPPTSCDRGRDRFPGPCVAHRAGRSPRACGSHLPPTFEEQCRKPIAVPNCGNNLVRSRHGHEWTIERRLHVRIPSVSTGRRPRHRGARIRHRHASQFRRALSVAPIPRRPRHARTSC